LSLRDIDAGAASLVTTLAGAADDPFRIA
jgi:hypothetical protein